MGHQGGSAGDIAQVKVDADQRSKQDTTHRGVYETLPGHEALITKVRWAGRSIISGDEAGEVRIWRPSAGHEAAEGSASSYTSSSPIKAHRKSISALSALSLGAGADGFLLITGGSDADIRTWRYTLDAVEPLQRFGAGGRMPLEFAVARLPGSSGGSVHAGWDSRADGVATQRSSSPSRSRTASFRSLLPCLRLITFSQPSRSRGTRTGCGV